jgi:hypothetical protein
MQKFAGCLLVLVALPLGAFAAIGWTVSDKADNRYLAYGVGGLALLLLVIGYSWTRTKRSSSWRADPATDRQREFARELGIKFPKSISKGELSDLISKVTGK